MSTSSPEQDRVSQSMVYASVGSPRWALSPANAATESRPSLQACTACFFIRSLDQLSGGTLSLPTEPEDVRFRLRSQTERYAGW